MGFIDRAVFDRLNDLLPSATDSVLAIPDLRHRPQQPESIVEELRDRIQGNIAANQGRLPEREAIFWHAYLSGLYEWSIISTGFRQLVELLPVLEDDSVRAILTGRPTPGSDSP